MALASSGNLSISQSVVSMLNEGMENPATGEIDTLMNAPTMFQAAQRIGQAIRRVHDIEGPALDAADVKFDVSFLFGGQIKGEKLRLYMIYTAGNFIECTIDTPYLQIGEHKYGKPILDRAVRYGIDIYDGLKIALMSMDSTLRSNLERRHADRRGGGAARRLRRRTDLSDRAGRPLFSRPERTLVGGAAGRAHGDPAPALRHAEINSRQTRLPPINSVTRNAAPAAALCDR